MKKNKLTGNLVEDETFTCLAVSIKTLERDWNNKEDERWNNL